MTAKNPKVDFFFENADQWREEFKTLRAIVLDSQLSEELKWGSPCYTLDKSNVVLIHGFKEYCALLFFKGALLQDPNGVLIQQTKNVQAGRQIRFTSAREILKLKPVLKAYIQEAIKAQQAGLKVNFKKSPDPIPEELEKKLNEMPALKAAFAALTPGRQRGYILHFASAKRASTREARVTKYVQQILDGKGLDDE